MSKTNGKRNREAGLEFERYRAEQYRALGYPNAVTTRSESKSRDDQKIDIMNRDEWQNGRLPYNEQCKCTTGTLPYAKLLSELPSVPGVINVVTHRQTKKMTEGRFKGKFLIQGEYAIMSLDDFNTLVAIRRQQEKELENPAYLSPNIQRVDRTNKIDKCEQ